MSRDEKTIRKSHPSFGVINLSRVSGHVALFGSATRHSNFIALSIKVADAISDPTSGEMRTFATEQVVEVYLSESQFAEFVSRWNSGEGTCCTIVRRSEPGSKLVSIEAPPPAAKPVRETFESVADAAISNLKDDLTRLADEIATICEGRLPKKSADRLHMILRTLRENPSPNLRFAQKMINEGLEKAMARAKLEMEAAARGILQRVGLASLADKATNLLPVPDFGDGPSEG